MPGPGRPRNEFVDRCRKLASNDDVLDMVNEILSDKKHPLFMAALKWASEHGYGKPKQAITLNTPDLTPEEREWRVNALLEIARQRASQAAAAENGDAKGNGNGHHPPARKRA
jgi:hypothetical protein